MGERDSIVPDDFPARPRLSREVRPPMPCDIACRIDRAARRVAMILSLLLLWFGGLSAPVQSQTPADERMMRDLRNAGSYVEAVSKCREALARPDIDRVARGWWTRWQLETATQAILAGEDFLDPSAWDALDELEKQFPLPSPVDAVGVRVALQHAIARRSQAEAIMATGDIPHLSADQRRRAEQLLQSTTERLADLARQFARPAAKPGEKRSPRGNGDKLHQTLRYQLAYEEAATRLLLASLHSPASESRRQQAREAQLRLSTLTRITSDPALADSSRLLEVGCLRMQDKQREAQEAIRRLAERPASQTAGDRALRILSEQVGGVGTDAYPPDAEAWKRLQERLQQQPASVSAVDRDVEVTARLALIRAAARLLAMPAEESKGGNPEEAIDSKSRDAWNREIQKQRDHLSSHFPRWRSLQAEREIRVASQGKTSPSPSPRQVGTSAPAPRSPGDANSAGSPQGPGSPKPVPPPSPAGGTVAERNLLNALIATVNERKAQGNLDGALEPCERAAALARKIGEKDLYFQLQFQAAAIFHQRQDSREAFRRFRELALEFPQHARAAEAHAIALRHAAIAPQLVASEATWDSLLREHLQHWPQGKTSNQCRLQLGRFLEQQGKADEAIDVWMQARGECDAWRELWAMLRSACQRKLQTLQRNGQPNADFQRAIANYWNQWSSKPDDASPDADTSAARVFGAEWSLLLAPDPAQKAADVRPIRQSLEAVNRAGTCPEDLRTSLRALTGYAAALLGDFAATRKAWEGMNWSSLDMAMPLLDGIDRLAQEAGDRSTAEEWNTLETQVLEQLQRIPSWADNPHTWQLKARIHLRRGERAEAWRIYSRLLEKLPRDVSLRREAAVLLDSGNSEEDRRASQENWQALIEASEPGSDDWFDGQLGLVRALLRSGKKTEAQKTLAELQSAHPELGGRERAAQFQRLLEENR